MSVKKKKTTSHYPLCLLIIVLPSTKNLFTKILSLAYQAFAKEAVIRYTQKGNKRRAKF